MKVIKLSIRDRTGEVIMPTTEIELGSLSYNWDLRPSEATNLFHSRMMRAFAVPAELLRPHVGAIEAAQQQEAVWRGYADWLGVAVRELTREQMAMAATRAVERQVFAAANAADSMRRLVWAMEQLRLKMIGRRCQIVTAVVLIVVYLLVEAMT